MSDLIRRTDAIKAIEDLPNAYNGWSDAYDKAYVIGTLEEVPTVEPKRGEWIEFDTKWGRSLYYCTNCMETSEVPTAFGKPLYNFCPNCGARMKGADDE